MIESLNVAQEMRLTLEVAVVVAVVGKAVSCFHVGRQFVLLAVAWVCYSNRKYLLLTEIA